MKVSKSSKILVFGLALSLAAIRPVPAAGIGNWVESRRTASAASGPDAATQWMAVSCDHVTISDYYRRLSSLSARVQTEVARRRWFRTDRDSAAVMGAVHGFIVSGQYDSAAIWAGRDPSQRFFGQFASARAKGRPFSFSDATGNGSDPKAADRLLLALWSGAGRETTDVLSRRIGKVSSPSDPVPAFLVALASRDTSGIIVLLEQVEKKLANPRGLEGSIFDRFGDPLIYWAAGQGHAVLAVNAGSRALESANVDGASQAHLYRGRGYYSLGELGSAEAEFKATTHPDDIGLARPCLAGIAFRRGDAKAALDAAQRCASAAESNGDGPSLIELAHVQYDLGITNWPTAGTAVKMIRKLIRKHQLNPTQTQEPYWALGLLAADTDLDSSKMMFIEAANNKAPYPGQGLPVALCVDNLNALVLRGLDQSFPPDLQFGSYGFLKFVDIVPATRSLVEGLRWLFLDIYPEEGGNQK